MAEPTPAAMPSYGDVVKKLLLARQESNRLEQALKVVRSLSEHRARRIEELEQKVADLLLQLPAQLPESAASEAVAENGAEK